MPDDLLDLPGLKEEDAPPPPSGGASVSILSPPDVVINLPGVPRGKGRPRTRVISRKGGGPAFAHVYTDAETRNYEAMLRYAGEQQMKGRPLHAGGVFLILTAAFPVPASWSQKKQAAALRGEIYHLGRPDSDNLLKEMDSFNGVVWKDDSQVVEAIVKKKYSNKPEMRFEIWFLV